MLLRALLQSIPAAATSTVRGAVPHSRAPVALSHHSPRGSQGSFTSLLPGSCMRPPPGPGLLGTYLHPAHTLGSQTPKSRCGHMAGATHVNIHRIQTALPKYAPGCLWDGVFLPSCSIHSSLLLMCPAQQEQERRPPAHLHLHSPGMEGSVPKGRAGRDFSSCQRTKLNFICQR